MNARLVRLGILGALVLVLGLVDRGILAKERIRRGGAVVYLALAPVDPRSLMQGDYMALRFALADALQSAGAAAAGWGSPAGSPGTAAGAEGAIGEGGFGWAPVALDSRAVASLAPPGEPVALRLRYRIRSGRVWLGTNAFFFEEGHAERYSEARFGEFRVDRESGEAVLVGLADATLRRL